MTVNEYAKKAGLSVDKVRKMCRNGKLKAVKVSGGYDEEKGATFRDHWDIEAQEEKQENTTQKQEEKSGWSEKKIERKIAKTELKSQQRSPTPETISTETDPEEGMSTGLTILCCIAVPLVVLGLMALLSRR